MSTDNLPENTFFEPIRHVIKQSGIILPILISLCVFVVEVLIMGFINILPELTPLSAAFLDAGILMVLLIPSLYFLIFRPCLRVIEQQEQQQNRLKSHIAQRTNELSVSNEMLQKEIQQRKKIEEEIRLERQKLFSVLDELPASVHLIGAGYNIRFANRYFREHFGSEDRPCYKILHDLEEPCLVCNAKDVLEGGCPGVFEEFHSDGRLYRVYNYPFIDTDGEKLVLQMGVDITEQKAAEDALRTSESKFRLLVNSLNDSVFTVDRSMCITSVYGELTKRLGTSPEAYVGKFISEVFDPETTRKHQKEIEKAFSGQHTVYEWEGSFPEGQRYMQNSLAPIIGLDGKIESVVGIARDITVKKKLENQIIETEKLMAVAQMSTMIAHEFRNALTSLRMILELLLEAEPDQKSLEVALSSVGHMEQIVGELLRFSRPVPMSFKLENLNEILEQSILFIKGQTTKHKIAVYQSFAENLQSLAIDAQHLKEAIINLLMNSIQSIILSGKPASKRSIRIVSRKKRTAAISVKDAGTDSAILGRLKNGDRKFTSYQVVQIFDSGTGIVPENLNQIFDPFFTTKKTGTGLGLAIVKRTVEAHGGVIKVKSRPGQGTSFEIYLPQI